MWDSPEFSEFLRRRREPLNGRRTKRKDEDAVAALIKSARDDASRMDFHCKEPFRSGFDERLRRAKVRRAIGGTECMLTLYNPI